MVCVCAMVCIGRAQCVYGVCVCTPWCSFIMVCNCHGVYVLWCVCGVEAHLSGVSLSSHVDSEDQIQADQLTGQAHLPITIS